MSCSTSLWPSLCNVYGVCPVVQVYGPDLCNEELVPLLLYINHSSPLSLSPQEPGHLPLPGPQLSCRVKVQGLVLGGCFPGVKVNITLHLLPTHRTRNLEKQTGGNT